VSVFGRLLPAGGCSGSPDKSGSHGAEALLKAPGIAFAGRRELVHPCRFRRFWRRSVAYAGIFSSHPERAKIKNKIAYFDKK
jgi:hypothetical protein